MSARSTLAAAASLVLVLGACARGERDVVDLLAPGARRPHLFVLLVDDLGWNDVGYHGSEIATPNIDRLAREGVRLERFYAQPQCTPARSSLLTGKHPLRLGTVQNLRPFDAGGLPLGERLLPELLQQLGYRTELIGKWHVGQAQPEQLPRARGFDWFYGLLSGYVDYTTHERNGELDWQRNGEPLHEEGYATRLLADEAERRIAAIERPTFMLLAFNAPHTPIHLAPGRDLSALSPEALQDEQALLRHSYVGMVEELDDAVGRVLEAIERRGIAEESLVLFLSDNGGAPRNGGSNRPLRDGKFSVFEGGVRVPAIARWSGRVEAGAIIDDVLSITDLRPTLLAAAGGRAKAPAPDGLDRLDVLLGNGTAEAARPPLFFGVHRPNSRRYAVLDGPWKLVELTQEVDGQESPTRHQLYRVFEDPGEETDLAAEHPERVEALVEILRAAEGPGLPR